MVITYSQLRTIYTELNGINAKICVIFFFGFTCSSNLTLSIGATAVLEIAAAIPPAKKSFMKLTTPSAMFGCYTCTVPILPTVLTETQRPSKCPRTLPTVLIYRRHLSREF